MTGEEMRTIREAWGMTQEAFAAAMGIGHRSRVSNMETGRRPIRGPLERLIRVTDEARRATPEIDSAKEGSDNDV